MQKIKKNVKNRENTYRHTVAVAAGRVLGDGVARHEGGEVLEPSST